MDKKEEKRKVHIIEGEIINDGTSGVVVDTDNGCFYFEDKGKYKVGDIIEILIIRDKTI